jgi:hypothetical protein
VRALTPGAVIPRSRGGPRRRCGSQPRPHRQRTIGASSRLPGLRRQQKWADHHSVHSGLGEDSVSGQLERGVCSRVARGTSLARLAYHR